MISVRKLCLGKAFFISIEYVMVRAKIKDYVEVLSRIGLGKFRKNVINYGGMGNVVSI